MLHLTGKEEEGDGEESSEKSLSVSINNGQNLKQYLSYSAVCYAVYEVLLTFESLNENLKYVHSNKSY